MSGWQRNENCVTIPKLPPPPRSAQKVALGVRLDDRAVGEDDGRGHEVVDREAHAARQVPHAAAEGQPADARGADDPHRDGEAVLVRSLEEVLEQRPAADASHLRRGVDLDRVHLRQVDHEPVVDGAEAAAVVPSAPHRDPKAVLDAVAQRCSHIRLVDAVRDRDRPLVDHRVEQRPGVVVVGCAGFDDASPDRRRQTLDGNSHLSPPSRVVGDATPRSCERERTFDLRC